MLLEGYVLYFFNTMFLPRLQQIASGPISCIIFDIQFHNAFIPITEEAIPSVITVVHFMFLNQSHEEGVIFEIRYQTLSTQ